MNNSKIKLLRILQILQDTDIDHPINTTGIIAKLKKSYDIDAERKSVMRDISTLMSFTEYDIVKCCNSNDGWYMITRDFEDHELKLFADFIASAKYLSEKDSSDILEKIINHASPSGRELIQSSLISDKGQKLRGAHFLEYFSIIIQAIRENKKIKFKYFEITKGNKLVHKRDGYEYVVSPYYTVLYDNEYFLIANTDGHNNASHYRIELMDELGIVNDSETKRRQITEIEGLCKDGETVPIEKYLRSSVNLWTGDLINVKLRCRNSCRLIIIKHFGDSWICENNDDTFNISVDVTDNEGFYKLIAQLGTDVQILSPDSAREHFKEYLRSILEQYDNQ